MYSARPGRRSLSTGRYDSPGTQMASARSGPPSTPPSARSPAKGSVMAPLSGRSAMSPGPAASSSSMAGGLAGSQQKRSLSAPRRPGQSPMQVGPASGGARAPTMPAALSTKAVLSSGQKAGLTVNNSFASPARTVQVGNTVFNSPASAMRGGAGGPPAASRLSNTAPAPFQQYMQQQGQRPATSAGGYGAGSVRGSFASPMAISNSGRYGTGAAGAAGAAGGAGMMAAGMRSPGGYGGFGGATSPGPGAGGRPAGLSRPVTAAQMRSLQTGGFSAAASPAGAGGGYQQQQQKQGAQSGSSTGRSGPYGESSLSSHTGEGGAGGGADSSDGAASAATRTLSASRTSASASSTASSAGGQQYLSDLMRKAGGGAGGGGGGGGQLPGAFGSATGGLKQAAVPVSPGMQRPSSAYGGQGQMLGMQGQGHGQQGLMMLGAGGGGGQQGPSMTTGGIISSVASSFRKVPTSVPRASLGAGGAGMRPGTAGASSQEQQHMQLSMQGGGMSSSRPNTAGRGRMEGGYPDQTGEDGIPAGSAGGYGEASAAAARGYGAASPASRGSLAASGVGMGGQTPQQQQLQQMGLAGASFGANRAQTANSPSAAGLRPRRLLGGMGGGGAGSDPEDIYGVGAMEIGAGGRPGSRGASSAMPAPGSAAWMQQQQQRGMAGYQQQQQQYGSSGAGAGAGGNYQTGGRSTSPLQHQQQLQSLGYNPGAGIPLSLATTPGRAQGGGGAAGVTAGMAGMGMMMGQGMQGAAGRGWPSSPGGVGGLGSPGFPPQGMAGNQGGGAGNGGGNGSSNATFLTAIVPTSDSQTPVKLVWKRNSNEEGGGGADNGRPSTASATPSAGGLAGRGAAAPGTPGAGAGRQGSAYAGEGGGLAGAGSMAGPMQATPGGKLATAASLSAGGRAVPAMPGLPLLAGSTAGGGVAGGGSIGGPGGRPGSSGGPGGGGSVVGVGGTHSLASAASHFGRVAGAASEVFITDQHSLSGAGGRGSSGGGGAGGQGGSSSAKDLQAVMSAGQALMGAGLGDAAAVALANNMVASPQTLEEQRKALQRERELQARQRLKAFVATDEFEGNATVDFYGFGKVLGTGSFGEVRLAWHRLAGVKVGIKSYEKSRITDPNQWKRVQQEIDVLARLNHPNVLRMLETMDTPKRVHIVTEYCSGGNLCTYVKNKGKLSESEARGIFMQLLAGIEYLHNQGIVHRDIKLENVLFDTEKRELVKLVDFGFAVIVRDPWKRLRIFCGTPSYMAPEICQRREYLGKPVDVWSLGVLLYAMLVGRFPFSGKTYPDLYKRIVAGQITLPDHVSNAGKDLIRRMLNTDASRRLTLALASTHPWVSPGIPAGVGAPPLPSSLAPPMAPDKSLMVSADPAHDVNEAALQRCEHLGFKRSAIISAVLGRERNACTTTYYLLLTRLGRSARVTPGSGTAGGAGGAAAGGGNDGLSYGGYHGTGSAGPSSRRGSRGELEMGAGGGGAGGGGGRPSSAGPGGRNMRPSSASSTAGAHGMTLYGAHAGDDMLFADEDGMGGMSSPSRPGTAGGARPGTASAGGRGGVGGLGPSASGDLTGGGASFSHRSHVADSTLGPRGSVDKLHSQYGRSASAGGLGAGAMPPGAGGSMSGGAVGGAGTGEGSGQPRRPVSASHARRAK